MKVHNFGNDYAFQRKQKTQPEVKPVELPATEVTTENYVGNQVQNRGEGEAMATTDKTPASKQKSKKKKETGSENEQS